MTWEQSPMRAPGSRGFCHPHYVLCADGCLQLCSQPGCALDCKPACLHVCISACELLLCLCVVYASAAVHLLTCMHMSGCNLLLVAFQASLSENKSEKGGPAAAVILACACEGMCMSVSRITGYASGRMTHGVYPIFQPRWLMANR